MVVKLFVTAAALCVQVKRIFLFYFFVLLSTVVTVIRHHLQSYDGIQDGTSEISVKHHGTIDLHVGGVESDAGTDEVINDNIGRQLARGLQLIVFPNLRKLARNEKRHGPHLQQLQGPFRKTLMQQYAKQRRGTSSKTPELDG